MIPEQANHKLEQVGGTHTDQGPLSFKINFKNCLSAIEHYLEDLILAGKHLIKNWLSRQMKSVAKIRQRIRPKRSYRRVSFKPRNSWTAYGKANGA